MGGRGRRSAGAEQANVRAGWTRTVTKGAIRLLHLVGTVAVLVQRGPNLTPERRLRSVRDEYQIGSVAAATGRPGGSMGRYLDFVGGGALADMPQAQSSVVILGVCRTQE